MSRPYKSRSRQEANYDKEIGKHTEEAGKVFGILPSNSKLPSKSKKLRSTQPQNQDTKEPSLILNLLPHEILTRIVETHYKSTLKYKLRDWISSILDDQLEKKKIEPEDWSRWLCANTNIIAIEILKKVYKERGPTFLDMKELCKNPIALPLIEQIYRENPNLIEYEELAGNSAAYDLLMEMAFEKPPTEMATEELPTEMATEELPTNLNFHWGNFSANSKAHSLIIAKSQKEDEMLVGDYSMLLDYEKLDWKKVSSNRSTVVLEFLFKVPQRINIGSLSGNPNPMAINFLKKRIEIEKRLSAEELKRLEYSEKIDWELLSGNYAALRLLIANKDKIFWPSLSPNVSAISLIKDRIRYEEKLIKESNEKQKQRDEKIADLNTKITTHRSEIINLQTQLKNPDLPEGLIFIKKNDIVVLEKKINKLEKKIDSEPPIENNFLFEPNILNWPGICTNSKAIKLLEDTYKKTPDKIHLQYLFANPSIFVLNHGDPSYPTELPIRFSSSSGNTKDVSSDNKSLKPGAKPHSAKKASSMKSPPKPRAQSLPVKKASSMKSPSPTKKTSVNMAISPPP